LEGTQQAQRVVLGASITAGLIALGLYVSGASPARAWSRLSPQPPLAGLVALPGSRHGDQEVVLNGRPTPVRVCWHPSRAPREVLAHYAKVAAGETAAGVPYVLAEAEHGGSVLWVTPEGTRKAVLVDAAPEGGTVFRLIAEEGASLRAGQPVPAFGPKPAKEVLLPGGAAAPPGVRVGFCVVNPDGSGTATLDANGAPRDVAARVLAELERVGFSVAGDDPEARLLSEALPQTRTILPLRHRSGTLSGHLSVSPHEAGVRAALTIRSGG
jgi:hypothetical protein